MFKDILRRFTLLAGPTGTANGFGFVGGPRPLETAWAKLAELRRTRIEACIVAPSSDDAVLVGR